MKNKLLIRISVSAIILLFSGLFDQTKAQVVITQKEKKSNPDVFFPNRKRTNPVVVRNDHPVVVRRENNLPPGHAKKIYGERSAKRFAPGQRKKSNNTWYSNKNSKHSNKKWKHHQYKNKKHHDD